MLLSPSKFLTRPFLRQLLENRFISPSGKEYCAEEVNELLSFKESNSALSDYARQIEEYHTPQPSEFGDHKNLCTDIVSTDDTPIKIQADTIFSLNELPPQCFIGTAHTGRAAADSAAEGGQCGLAPPIKHQKGATQVAPSKRRKSTMLETSALEKSLKITSKPKEIDVDSALELLDEWITEFSDTSKSLKEEIKKRGSKQSPGSNKKGAR